MPEREVRRLTTQWLEGPTLEWAVGGIADAACLLYGCAWAKEDWVTRRQAREIYIVLVGWIATVIVGLAAFLTYRSAPSREELLAIGVFALLGWFTSRRRVYFAESHTISLGSISQMATVVLFPLPAALCTIALGKAINEISLLMQGKRGRTWRHVAVNSGGVVLASAAGGGAFVLLKGNVYLWQSGPMAVLALPGLAALAALYYFADVSAIAGAVSLSSHESPWAAFRNISRGTLLPEVSLILVGIVFAVILHFSPVLSLFVFVPVILSLRAFESVARLRKETIEAVLKLAESIDYRDTGTYEHSQRIADLTRRLCQSVGLMAEHADQVVLASKVHDLGKIGISNEILLKQGPLTMNERHVMQEHPLIGANILSSYSAFKDSVDIVKHHHERWDGTGYPDGLRGTEIPVGSRIVAVVDAFDSMTADRPYRAGMRVEDAVERLKDGMGSQFDTQICAAFLQMLIESGVYVPTGSGPNLHVVSSRTG